MKKGRPQCKDIPNGEFLNAVAVVNQVKGRWAHRWEVGAVLAGHPELIMTLPSGITIQVDWGQLFPQKLIIAKARKLIRRGLLDGCYCGCRGDFQLTGLTIVGNTIYERSEL